MHVQLLRSPTPATLFWKHLDTLRGHMPGVLDGSTDSIHDARVATRRLRELLPLMTDRQRVVEELQRRLKRIGRALGRVRDSDVLIEMVESLEARIPHAAPTLVVLRQRHERERMSLMRTLIKTLEKLEAEKLLAVLAANGNIAQGVSWRRLADRAGWRPAIERGLAARADLAASAVQHATGVYFPKRAHNARIAIKKLRYVLEIADGTGGRNGQNALPLLKQVQDLLGEIHDRQVLVDELSASAATADEGTRERLTLVTHVVEAENRTLHGKYLALRQAVLDVCEMEPRMTRRVGLPPLAAAGALAMSAVWLTRRHAFR